MNEEEIIELARRAILIIIEISLPTMMVGLIIGVTIALLQALTQVQEITLVFVPKIIAIMLALFIFLPGMTATLIGFMQFLAGEIIAID
jgi:flagellar biosynthetic protein FliQ